ncbi:MAG: IS66 family insertion sequence element accessory protein TnpB [Xanthobacteraceae bacterium]
MGRRRRWSEDEKLRIVLESLQAPRQVSATARRYGVSRSLLLEWRRSFRAEQKDADRRQIGFVAATVIAESEHGGTCATIGQQWRDRDRVCDRGADADRWRGRRCDGGGSSRGVVRWITAAMIPLPTGVRVWLATGYTDMRKGFPSLALQVQEILQRDPLSGHLFCFRGRRGNLLKVIWHDGQGACLFTKRLERGRFLWPSLADGVVAISSAQLGYLLSGIDWRHPQETTRPTSVG